MVTIKQLIDQPDFNHVWEYIVRYYKNRKRKKAKYKSLYKKLLTLTPTENRKNMYIYITALKDDGNDDYYSPESFDENDPKLYFDVSGKDDDYYGY